MTVARSRTPEAGAVAAAADPPLPRLSTSKENPFTVGDNSLMLVMTALNISPDLGSAAVRTICSGRTPLAVLDSRGGVSGDVDIEGAALKCRGE